MSRPEDLLTSNGLAASPGAVGRANRLHWPTMPWKRPDTAPEKNPVIFGFAPGNYFRKIFTGWRSRLAFLTSQGGITSHAAVVTRGMGQEAA